MPRKKQQCPFRIPWISGPSARSQSRPKQTSKSSSQLDTNTTIQQPPFRPPGIAYAPPQPPPTHVPGSPISEPQQLSTSHPPQPPASSVILESPGSESPPRPSTPTRVKVNYPPPLSSSINQTQDPSPSLSPSHAGRSIKVPPEPAAEKSTRPRTKAKMKSPLKPAENSKAPLERQRKPHQSKLKGKEKVVEQPIEVRKINDKSIRRPKPELHTTASASGVQRKDASHSGAFRADKKQEETRETLERKMMFAIASPNPSGKDIKFATAASADPVTSKNVSTISNEMQKGIIMKDDVSNFVNKVATVNPTQPMDDKAVSVVTLAGDNRGATMHVADSHSQSTRKKGLIQVHRTHRTNQEESTSREKEEAGKAYVNSNIQSVNNSFMLHGSINGRDPGVRVIIPQQPEQEENKPGLGQVNSINRAERLTYRPMVRRRCLRGLFLEPSDSDPDNPDKPRRHGQIHGEFCPLQIFQVAVSLYIVLPLEYFGKVLQLQACNNPPVPHSSHCQQCSCSCHLGASFFRIRGSLIVWIDCRELPVTFEPKITPGFFFPSENDALTHVREVLGRKIEKEDKRNRD